MDLRTLHYFVTVLEAGSLSRAAGMLYVAQPALTAQIKKLESELGVTLFQRSHAGVTPTAVGMQLYEDARRLLGDAEAMRQRIRHLPQGPEGTVTLALPSLLTAMVSGQLLTRAGALYPRIRIFILDELSPKVRQIMVEGRADLGILADTLSAKGLHCQRLAREPIYFYGRDRDGAARKLVQPLTTAVDTADTANPDTHSLVTGRIPFAEAVRFPLLLQSRHFAVRLTVEKAALRHNLQLNVKHEHNSARVLRSLSHQAAGFGFLPACGLYQLDPPDNDWVFARVSKPALERSYVLATPAARKPSAATDAVADILVQELQQLVASGQWDAKWLFSKSGQTSA